MTNGHGLETYAVEESRKESARRRKDQPAPPAGKVERAEQAASCPVRPRDIRR